MLRLAGLSWMNNQAVLQQSQNHRIRGGVEKFCGVRIWAFMELSFERYLSQKTVLSIQRAEETEKDT